MIKEELVSVIIPTYKHTDVLSYAIDSVLEQTYNNIEVIVVDDNPDNSVYRQETKKIIEKYQKDKRVIYIKNDKNSERSYSRNNGVKYSNGKYLMFLDNDDVFLKNKINSQIQCMKEKGEEYGVCYSNYIRCKNEKIVWKSSETREGNLQFEVLARNMPIHPGSNLMIRRSEFLKVQGFNEKISMNEDIDLLVRILNNTKIAYCSVCGLKVNLHDYSDEFNLLQITNEYRKIEVDVISTLTDKQKEELDILHGLQLYKFYILKDIRLANYIKKNYNLTLLQIIKYSIHLIKRKVTRKAYGYKL